MVQQQIFAPQRQVFVSPDNQQWYNEDGSTDNSNDGSFIDTHFNCILSFAGNIGSTYIKAKSDEKAAKNQPTTTTVNQAPASTSSTVGKSVLIAMGVIGGVSLIIYGIIALTKPKSITGAAGALAT